MDARERITGVLFSYCGECSKFDECYETRAWCNSQLEKADSILALKWGEGGWICGIEVVKRKKELAGFKTHTKVEEE